MLTPFKNYLKILLGCKEAELQEQLENVRNAYAEAIKAEPEPEMKGIIDYSEVAAILKPHCKNYYISDEYFRTCTVTAAKKFSNAAYVDAKKYQLDNHDCDNYSFELQGYWSKGLYSYPFGIAWTDTHAFNIFINNEKQLFIVEPQANMYYKLEDKKNDTNYYPFRVVML